MLQLIIFKAIQYAAYACFVAIAFRSAWEWGVYLVLRRWGEITTAYIARVYLKGKPESTYADYVYEVDQREYVRTQQVSRQTYHAFRKFEKTKIRLLRRNPHIARLVNDTWDRMIFTILLILPVAAFGPVRTAQVWILGVIVCGLSVLWRVTFGRD